MTQEALKLALKFVEDSECGTADLEARIKEALAQEQEPVAYLCENAVGHRYFRWKKPSSTYKPLPLYTTPPQRTWVGLTEQEHTDIAVECGCLSADWVFYGAAVERKLKERNT